MNNYKIKFLILVLPIWKRELKPIIPPFINFRITHAYPCSHIGGVNWNTKSKKIFEVLVLSIRGSVSDNAPRMESMNRNYGANRTSRWAGRILYVGAWIETNECKKFFCSYLWVLLMWGSVNWNDMRCLRLPAPHRTLYTGSVNWNLLLSQFQKEYIDAPHAGRMNWNKEISVNGNIFTMLPVQGAWIETACRAGCAAHRQVLPVQGHELKHQ